MPFGHDHLPVPQLRQQVPRSRQSDSHLLGVPVRGHVVAVLTEQVVSSIFCALVTLLNCDVLRDCRGGRAGLSCRCCWVSTRNTSWCGVLSGTPGRGDEASSINCERATTSRESMYVSDIWSPDALPISKLWGFLPWLQVSRSCSSLENLWSFAFFCVASFLATASESQKRSFAILKIRRVFQIGWLHISNRTTS